MSKEEIDKRIIALAVSGVINEKVMPRIVELERKVGEISRDLELFRKELSFVRSENVKSLVHAFLSFNIEEQAMKTAKIVSTAVAEEIEKTELSKAVETVSKAVEEARKAQKNLRETLVSFTAEIKKLTAATTELSKAYEAIPKLSAKIDELSDKIASLTVKLGEVAELASKVDELASKIDKIEKAISKIPSEKKIAEVVKKAVKELSKEKEEELKL